MQLSPKIAITTPPSGREPVATAVANPAIRPAAASSDVGALSVI
jgi:hypothetical protein